MRAKFCDGITRRELLRTGFAGLTGLSLADILHAEEAASSGKKPTADSVLFVNLAGGPAHQDTLDMKPEAPAETRGEFQSIQTSLPGLSICEHLPQLAKMIDRFTLLRGISHSVGSHPEGQKYIATGNRPVQSLLYPSYGSVTSKLIDGPEDLPNYVAIPKTEWTAGYLGDAWAPFKTNTAPKAGEPYEVRGISLSDGLTIEAVSRREKLLTRFDRLYRDAEVNSSLLEALDTFGDQARNMVTSDRAREAFDTGREPESIRKRFANDELNQSLLLGIRLIENGVPFVTVTNAGWDTHLDNFTGHKRLLGPLDHALPAMLNTLEEKGLLERTLVVVMGEFGRTPKINSNAGRDHWPRANWCLLAGGGVQPGQLIGGTDAGGTGPDDGTDISPDDIAATLYHAIGIDPLHEFYTRTGRPVMLVPEGRVMHNVFG